MSNTKAALRRDLVLEEVRRLGYRNGNSLTKQLWNWGQRDLAARLTRGYRTNPRRAA